MQQSIITNKIELKILNCLGISNNRSKIIIIIIFIVKAINWATYKKYDKNKITIK